MYAFFWGETYDQLGGMDDYQGSWSSVDEIKQMVQRREEHERATPLYPGDTPHYWAEIAEIAPDGLHLLWSFNSDEGWSKVSRHTNDDEIKIDWLDFSDDEHFQQYSESVKQRYIEQTISQTEHRMAETLRNEQNDLIQHSWSNYRRALSENAEPLRATAYGALLEFGEIDRLNNLNEDMS